MPRAVAPRGPSDRIPLNHVLTRLPETVCLTRKQTRRSWDPSDSAPALPGRPSRRARAEGSRRGKSAHRRGAIPRKPPKSLTLREARVYFRAFEKGHSLSGTNRCSFLTSHPAWTVLPALQGVPIIRSPADSESLATGPEARASLDAAVPEFIAAAEPIASPDPRLVHTDLHPDCCIPASVFEPRVRFTQSDPRSRSSPQN